MKNLLLRKQYLLLAFSKIGLVAMAQRRMTLLFVIFITIFYFNAMAHPKNDWNHKEQNGIHQTLTTIGHTPGIDGTTNPGTVFTGSSDGLGYEMKYRENGLLDFLPKNETVKVTDYEYFNNQLPYLPSGSVNEIALSGTDLFIVCQPSGDENLDQVNRRYKLKPSALFLKEGNPNPISTITHFLEEKSCNNLHLYITFSGNDIMINDFKLNLQNITEYITELKKWKIYTSGNILIHNLSIAERSEKPAIINKIEEITGLKVEILSSY